MKKLALILHGWPQPVEPGSINYPYLKYFQNKGYKVVAPKLFTNDFVLKLPDAKNYIEKLLHGNPDVIVGISFGGLLAPQIAKDYPDAKLILIATNPKMEPSATGFKIVFNLAKYKTFLQILNLIKYMPSKFLFAFYEFINPFKGNSSGRQLYLSDMRQNIKYMMAISVSKEQEIINFNMSIDNTNLLKSLGNKTLIFSGKNDLMMPMGSENNLHTLLKNSREIVRDGGHFEVFKNENFKDLDNFLN